jgi:hypothetical protein
MTWSTLALVVAVLGVQAPASAQPAAAACARLAAAAAASQQASPSSALAATAAAWQRASQPLSPTTAAAAALQAASPRSSTPISSTRRDATALVGAAVNPAGLMARVDVSWRRPLSRSSSPLLSDAHLSVGVTPEVSPSYARAGAWAELAPASIVAVRVGIEPSQYFGTFSSLLSFSDLRQPFDRRTMRERSAEARPGNALRVYVRPSIRGKFGRIGAQVSGEVERWWSTAQGPFFHEPGRNTLISVSGGTVRTLSAAVLCDASSRLGLGAAFDLTHVPGAAANRIQRVGPLATWVPPFSIPLLGRPVVTAVAGAYLRDPNRKGQLFGGVGLGFSRRTR